MIDALTLLVLDTETTGLDVENDRVVQLGAVYWKAGERLGKRRSMLVNPGIPIPQGAEKVHGIGDAQVASAPDFAQVGARLARHLADGPDGSGPPALCGYNAVSYDIPLLNAEFARHGLSVRIDPGQVLDPIVFVRWHHRGWRFRKLEVVAQQYGFTLRDAHSAAADAEATAEVMSAMMSAGLIPADWDEALQTQHRLQQSLDEEWKKYGYALYRDRSDESLRLGFGKHTGCLLDDVDPQYLRFCHDTFADLTPETREQFSRRLDV